MKTAIFYHSLTGNSLTIAKFLNQKLPSSTVININSFKTADMNNFETFALVFPTFHLNCSTHVLEFLNKLPSLEGKRFLLVQTFSTMPGKAIKNICRILEEKGAYFLTSHRIAMPESYPVYRKKKITNSDFPTSDGLENFNRFTEDLISRLDRTNAKKEKPETSLWDYLIPPPKPTKIKKEFGTLLTGDNCSRCGICAEACPDKAITLNEYPHFDSSKCSNCFTCYNLCPIKNISTTTIEAGFGYSGASDVLKGRFV